MMTNFNPKLMAVIQQDPRYAYEAYDFIFHAIQYTQRVTGREMPREGESVQKRHHVSGPELLEGIRQLALAEFGMLAKTVFHMWGIHTTDDWGNIVFNLINGELMSKTSEDNLDDFHAVYDFNEALDYRITLDEAR
jgi:uncharacterized repeat protein (TIGR04138 family)